MNWELALKNGYEQPEDVAEFLSLSTQEEQNLRAIVEEYPMRVPAYYLALIDPADRDDPIRRMSIPEMGEGEEGGVTDTSGEYENTVLPGMQHKYPQTVMILSNNQCAMYCRHCFRKRMVGLSENETVQNLPEIEAYVRAHTEINNVLISGGDSLLNNNALLRSYLEIFSEIDHIDFIRFGTRMPVVLPQRITEDDEISLLFEQYNRKKQIFVITQFNHPRELTAEALKAVAILRKAGCIVRNQTVLLRGVNDQPQVLAALMNGLTKIGAIPYYIFQCRPARGVKHQFQIPLLQSSEIVEQAKLYMNGQAKSVRHVMAHISGKITILGAMSNGDMLFKYHQAKDPKNASRIFVRKVAQEDGWIDAAEIID